MRGTDVHQEGLFNLSPESRIPQRHPLCVEMVESPSSESHWQTQRETLLISLNEPRTRDVAEVVAGIAVLLFDS